MTLYSFQVPILGLIFTPSFHVLALGLIFGAWPSFHVPALGLIVIGVGAITLLVGRTDSGRPMARRTLFRFCIRDDSVSVSVLNWVRAGLVGGEVIGIIGDCAICGDGGTIGLLLLL